ncbi:MAG: DUF4397 domain-containing protein [Bacteroidota bacterium]
MRKISLLLFSLVACLGAFAQTANVQIIHNSADPAAATVDIYINSGSTPAIDDLSYLEATAFLALPANAALTVGVAPGSSTGPADIIASFPLPALTPNENYVVVANGVLDPNQFDTSANGSNIAFNLEIITPALMMDNGNNVSLAVFHGSPDAPAVDVLANNAGPLVPNLSYGNATGYVSLPPAEYFLSVTPAGANNVIVGTFVADVSGLAGGAGVAFASGFLNPAANQNGAAFGLYVALPDGTVLTLPAVDCSLGILDFTLIDAQADTVITAYDPIPDGAMIDLAAVGTDRLNVRANLCPGFGAGSIGFDVSGSQSYNTTDNNKPFALFRDNGNGNFYIWPKPRPKVGESYSLTATAYSAKHQKGTAGTPQSVNFSFVNSSVPAQVQIIHNSADPAAATVDIYLNNGSSPAIEDVDFRTATPFIDLPSATNLTVGVAPGNSTGPTDIIANFPIGKLTAGEKYVVMANGVLHQGQFDQTVNTNIGFTLRIFTPAQTSSGNNDVALLAYHGATDAPAVDILANSAPLVPNLSFGNFAGYVNVPAAVYTLDVTPAGQNTNVLASYRADLSGLGGGAAVVFASGFLNPANNQNGAAFGLFAALPDGTVIELPPPGASVQIIHNSPDPAAATVDIYINGGATPAIDDLDFRSATPFLTLPSGVPLTVGVAPGTSTGPADIIASFPLPALTLDEKYVVMANGVLDPTQFDSSVNGTAIGFDLKILTPASTNSSAGNVDVVAFHGSPDAPAVDVLAFQTTPPIIPNLSFGTFSGYLTLPAATYVLDVTPAGQNSVVVRSSLADISGLGSGATVVFASGFLNPVNNQNGASFALLAALPDGTVIELPEFDCDLGILNFSLINAKTDDPVAGYDPIVDGAVIDLTAIGTDRLNIRANLCPGFPAGSVQFQLSGSQMASTNDNNPPFALFGDNGNGGFFQWPKPRPSAGDSFTLSATSFGGNSGQGSNGISTSVSFSFVGSARLAEELADLVLYPNPSTGSIQLDIPANLQQESLSIQILNTMGQTVFTQNLDGAVSYRLDLDSLPDGIYILNLQSRQEEVSRKLVIQR